MISRRCICGRSRRLPLCDGSHQSQQWRCRGAEPAPHPRLFVAVGHNQNIAERMAHNRGGVALHAVSGQVGAELVVVISDGADLDALSVSLDRVSWQQLRVLLIGGDPAMLRGLFPQARIQAVPDSDQPALLWRALSAALDQPADPAPAPTSGAPRLFLSHATADEDMLQPVIDTIRRIRIDVFLCGDSIPGGARWWDTILDALRRCDRFVLVLSADARQSPWCAFEVGAAVALGKPIQLISLDDAPPPSFISHLQMAAIPRLQRQRPWLTTQDALVEALVTGPAPHPASTPAGGA